MSTLASQLFQLQEIDSHLDSARAALTSTIHQLESDPDTVAGQRELDRCEGELRQARSQLRSLEAQAEDLRVTMRRLNDRLYGGMIHDAREMKSAETEIEHAKAHLLGLEDEELSLMERIEVIDDRVRAAEKRLEQARSRRQESLGPLEETRKRLAQEIDSLQSRRVEQASALKPRDLDRYRSLRDRYGHAVSHVQNGICQWCRVQVPPADVQHARGETLVTCTNCARILYAD